MSHKFICPVCRKSYKGDINLGTGRRVCCGYKLICLGHKVRPPKPHQKRRWQEFVKRFLLPVHPYWMNIDKDKKRAIFMLWTNLGMKDKFLEILRETEKIYWEGEEKGRSHTEIRLKVSDYLKKEI